MVLLRALADPAIEHVGAEEIDVGLDAIGL
jgi:hypothetical protein